jgi:hypothetical protein
VQTHWPWPSQCRNLPRHDDALMGKALGHVVNLLQKTLKGIYIDPSRELGEAQVGSVGRKEGCLPAPVENQDGASH